MICIFGYGNCDEEPDIGAFIVTLPYRVFPDDFCLPGNLGCWGGAEYADWLENGYYPSLLEQNYWVWHHPAQAWGLSADSLKTLMIEGWFFEQGGNPQRFGPDHPATQILMNHRGVEQWRQQFYRGGCQDIVREGRGELYEPAEENLERASTEIRSHIQVAYEILFRIEDSEQTIKDIRQFMRDANVKAIVVRIDSPGGAVGASQELFQEIRQLDEIKPVVVSMGSVAASGGYYAALGARTIVANPGTITGSIGVIMKIPNLRKLMEKLGIGTTVIKSGRLKDPGSVSRDLTPEEIKEPSGKFP
jgi:signal peptide peptidase SppA